MSRFRHFCSKSGASEHDLNDNPMLFNINTVAHPPFFDDIYFRFYDVLPSDITDWSKKFHDTDLGPLYKNGDWGAAIGVVSGLGRVGIGIWNSSSIKLSAVW